jgi:outer membrane protein W
LDLPPCRSGRRCPAAQAQGHRFLAGARARHAPGFGQHQQTAHLKATLTGLGSAEASINDKWLPELDISYFFTPNLAAELILTYPQKQKLSITNVGEIGTFKHLPPTLTCCSTTSLAWAASVPTSAQA